MQSTDNMCIIWLLHNSAGVGRTGTYIALNNVMDQTEAENIVDIDRVIVKMRNQRMKMVQTKVFALLLSLTQN